MNKDAKAAEKQRLAEALRANLRRRKATQETPIQNVGIKGEKDGARETRADGGS